MRLFEYVDRRSGVYTDWYRSRQKREQAALDAKLDVVRKAGEAPNGTTEMLPPNLMRGPCRYRGKFYPHTWKLTVNGPVRLRPLCCPGPIEADSEWTILVPAVEKGNQMPEGAFEQAEQRRVEVIADPVNRRREVSDDDDG